MGLGEGIKVLHSDMVCGKGLSGVVFEGEYCADEVGRFFGVHARGDMVECPK